MSLTRKASSLAKKPTKPPRQDLAKALAEREAELAQARRERTATSEILQVIASSPGDLQPVLDKIAETACRLCKAYDALVLLREGDQLRAAGHYGPIPVTFASQAISRGLLAGRAVIERRAIHIDDIAKHADEYPVAAALASRGAAAGGMLWRANVVVPLMREGEAVGTIGLRRAEPAPFSEGQIELLKTFSHQAVVAIENARLFNETQEALEQQKASADVLSVIGKSVSDAAPVFETILDACQRLFGSDEIGVYTIGDDGMVRVAAWRGPRADEVRRDVTPLADSVTGRIIRERRTHHIPDLRAEPGLSPIVRERAERLGSASLLYAPMLWEERGLGSILVARSPPRPFSDREQALLQTFADQAAIAIENARLFRETQEALERQTATSEILRVISQSPTDPRPVFESIVAAAARLLGCDMAAVLLRDGDAYVHTAGATPEGPMPNLAPIRVPIDASANFPSRAFLSNAMVHLPDWSLIDLPEHERHVRDMFGVNSALYLPLLRGDASIAVLVFIGKQANAFGPGEIAQAEAFRDQALIAIENARLFDEVQARTKDLQEALQQQTATADVLKAISRSAFDLDVVLETLVSTAGRLCGASHSQIFRRHGDVFRYATSQMDVAPAYREYEQSAEIRAGRGTLIGRVALEERAIEIADAWNDPEYTEKDQARVGNVRAMLGVPLMRNGELVGAFALARAAPVPFTKRQVDLVTTFADQAVIAIENVRLFDEVQAKTHDLEEALEHQTATSEVLSAISRSPTEVQPVFDAIARSATELCDATSGGVDRFDGEFIHLAAHCNWTPEALAAMRQIYPATPGRGFASARAILTRSVVHIPDISLDPEYTATAVVGVGFRSVLAVPMLRDGEPIGAIALVRLEPRPFTARQVALLQTFAEQAVIAINNVRLFDEVQARTRQVEEALAQQTATADVLKVISRSAFDLQTVLDTLAASAAGLLGANFAAMYLKRGDVIRADATFGASPGMVRFMNEHPQSPGRKTIAGRVFQTGEVQNVPDVREDPEYDYGEAPRLANFRALLGVPMFRDGKVEGSFTLGRAQPGPFTRRQIELVQTFADQAVIAIENVRLFDEVQARTKDLEESLQQQTATANVLKVISRSAFDLDAVLKTLSNSARSLSNAVSAVVMLRDGDVLRLRAESGCDPQFLAYMAAHPTRAGKETLTGRVFLRGEAVSIPDALADPDYKYGDAPQLNNYRALLGAPLIRDGKVEGVFGLMHPKPGGFTPRQMELVRTFADQAVIAIENARLLDEVQARTRDIEEALQQQTATADVLKVISRSTFDLQPVLDTLVESAARLCDTEMAFILRRDGEVFRAGAAVGYAPEYMAYLQSHPLGINRGSVTGRVALEGRVVQIADVTTDPEYTLTQTTSLTGQRTSLGVPLIRDGEVIGVIVLARRRVETFTERQIELVTTFADQAVIAISNVGLFNETQEALKQQTATADVLKVISRSAFDLQTVLETLITTAVELNEAHSGTVCVRDGDVFRYRAFHSARDTRQVEAYLRRGPVEANRGSIAGRTILSGQVEQIPDLLEDAEYNVPLSTLDKPWRAVVGVPMLGKTRLEGVFTLTRLEPGPYSPRQIEILQTFADQAVIAIENARLFGEVQARTKELAASLDDLQKAQDRLIQSEKLASLGQLTAGIAHEIKNPLNFINNFSALSRELIGELAGVIRTAPLDGALRDEAEELIGTIDGNLDKVVQHGKRADSIVKNMLLHSREGSGERSTTNINAMVEEALNLAYHGARAEKPGFNVTMAKSLDPNAGAAEVYAQEISRVLLNLISNGFYAATKRKQAEGNGSYEPTLTASTRDLGNSVEIAIRDNGTGISDAVKARMFNPFFTTKPAGEGTGLGLSLSHDIVVKQHGGTLEVLTEPGSYTQFTIVLPRANLLPPTPLPPGEEGS